MVKWQPIATAPKDGTTVDLYVDGSRLTDYAWHSGYKDWVKWTDCGSFTPFAEPTHWMSLPEDPE